MWTAKLLKKEFSNGKLEVTVEYADGENKTVVRYKNVSDLKDLVRKKINELNKLKEQDTSLKTGDIDITEPTPKPEPEPTPDEIAKETFSSDLLKLKQVKELINLGVVEADNPKVVALIKKIKAEIKPEYI